MIITFDKPMGRPPTDSELLKAWEHCDDATVLAAVNNWRGDRESPTHQARVRVARLRGLM